MEVYCDRCLAVPVYLKRLSLNSNQLWVSRAWISQSFPLSPAESKGHPSRVPDTPLWGLNIIAWGCTTLPSLEVLSV